MTKTGSLTGKTIDRYEFQELIGTGSFGKVYKAVDKKLLRNVAIKATAPDLIEQGCGKELLIHEATIHARAEHVNIIPIYDVLDYEQSILIVMRLVSGENLENILSRLHQPLNIDDAMKIMHQVLWGMDYAHSKGIVHLDLKPGNIRISHYGEAFVMDFGIASMLGDLSLKNHMTQGTPHYMAPEQIDSSYVDARSDIYSLCVILYKMITGHHPFEKANTVFKILKCHIEESPIAPSHYIETLPENFEKAILKALEKKSSNRFRSCREFALALGHSLEVSMSYDFGNKDIRWDPRVVVYLKARIQLSEGDELISAETINLSASGANLSLSSDIPVGSKVGLELYIPDNDAYMKVCSKATVLWKDNKPSMDNIDIGVSLDEIEDRDRLSIGIFVRNLLMSVEQDDLPGDDTLTFW